MPISRSQWTPTSKVTDEKRKAQSKVVKMLLPGIRKAVISLMDFSGLAAEMMGFYKFFRMLASRTGVEPVSPP